MMEGSVVMEEDKVGARKRCGILETVQYPGGWEMIVTMFGLLYSLSLTLFLLHIDPSTGVWNAVVGISPKYNG